MKPGSKVDGQWRRNGIFVAFTIWFLSSLWLLRHLELQPLKDENMSIGSDCIAHTHILGTSRYNVLNLKSMMFCAVLPCPSWHSQAQICFALPHNTQPHPVLSCSIPPCSALLPSLGEGILYPKQCSTKPTNLSYTPSGTLLVQMGKVENQRRGRGGVRRG